MDQFSERRRHPRQDVFSAVMITPDGEHEGVMAMAMDLSAGGARVGLLSDWRPSVGAPVLMSFLFDTDRAIVLECRAIRVTADHVAVTFAPAREEGILRLMNVANSLH